MYSCRNCWNDQEFIENYTDSVRVYLNEWQLCHSESDPKLIEVACVKCNHSTEDSDILVDWELFTIY